MRRALLVGLAAALWLPAAASAQGGAVKVDVSADRVALTNGLVERTWSRAPFRTVELADRRAGGRVWSSGTRDFTLVVGAAEIGSEQFNVTAVETEPLDHGGLRLELELTGPPGLTVRRIAEMWPGIAGLRMRTIIETAAATPVSAAVLEEAAAGAATPTAHALRAGADWRDPEYSGPPVVVGEGHGGTWRDTRTAARGAALAAPAQWLGLAEAGRDLALIAEGTDFPSNRATYDGATGRLRSDFGRDVILLGPFEESGHIENPTEGPGRARTARAGRPLALDPVIVAFGAHDGDVEWQAAKMLRELRGRSVQHVIFNSDRIDSNKRSTGAKDDVDIERVRELAPVARAMGIETFVLDDGWQARSGDWCPDSPQCPEPRSTWGPRFPDADFTAVREAIAPMKLGLWMSPLHYHPSAQTPKDHPEWKCQPVATGLDLYNTGDATSGSNEAGIGAWGPDALPYLEGRIRKAIVEWRVTYFKFDFIAWLDCAGQGDLHDFRDGFLAMLDRLRAEHPGVTFTIDETNDYRLFPFASTSRGATWFQNGNPGVHHLLHNLWNLSPYVPAQTLGQNVIGEDRSGQPLPTMLAAGLASHMTFFHDIRRATAADVQEISRWTAFYRAERERFGGVVYPLLDDPFAKGWTALQTWDPDEGSGALLAFRQDSGDAARRIALRNVPDGRRFSLRLAPTGQTLGSATSAELRAGLEVAIPQARGAAVVLIDALD